MQLRLVHRPLVSNTTLYGLESLCSSPFRMRCQALLNKRQANWSDANQMAGRRRIDRRARRTNVGVGIKYECLVDVRTRVWAARGELSRDCRFCMPLLIVSK